MSRETSKLGSYQAGRSLAKASLEDGLRIVNDFYWGILASTRFASETHNLENIKTFVAGQVEFRGQGRLRSENLKSLVEFAEKELPKFGLILLFSYFEPYLRELSLNAILSNPAVVTKGGTAVDGEAIAHDESLLSAVLALASPIVEDWLKGDYANRFGRLRRFLGIPQAVTEPYVEILDDYYAKRNCLFHREGLIDSKAKRYFEADNRNEVGSRVVIERRDFLSLHRAIHSASDKIDAYVMEHHIQNAEVLRLLHRFKREFPDWTAKHMAGELLRRRFPRMVSRNQIAQVLDIPVE